MHTELFLARQPILDKDEKIYGYELLYRPSSKLLSGEVDDFRATSHTLVAMAHAGDFDELFMHKKGFINADAKMLTSAILEVLPKHIFIIEVLESVDIAATVSLLQRLRTQGFRLAWDDFVCNEASLATLKRFVHLFDIIKFDMYDSAINKEYLQEALTFVQQNGVMALAEKVESQEEYEDFRAMGFTLFQGYYFAKPQLHRAHSANFAKLKLLEILQIPPSKTDAIAAAIQSEPTLALNLLQLVNSSFFALRTRIGSIRQALMYIGANNLRKWLLLMLYAKDDTDPSDNALLQSVKLRAECMARLANVVGLDSEKAYLIGLLSLVDAILAMSKQEVLTKMRFLDHQVHEALLYNKNRYAMLVSIAEELERGAFENAQQDARALGVDAQMLADIYYEVLCNKSS